MNVTPDLPDSSAPRLTDAEIATAIWLQAAKLNAWLAYAAQGCEGLMIDLKTLDYTEMGSRTAPHVTINLAKPIPRPQRG